MVLSGLSGLFNLGGQYFNIPGWYGFGLGEPYLFKKIYKMAMYSVLGGLRENMCTYIA